jgi:hypothetical protein
MPAGEKKFPEAADPLTFTTTLIGDTVRLDGEEWVVTQKYPTERRLLLRPTARDTALPRSVSEFEYNGAGTVLVASK